VECVQPIRDVEQVHEIERRLYERKEQSEKNWRQYMLFELGIYTGLRISDLARLKVSDVRGREVLTLKETKTGKQTNLPLSRKVQGVIRRELKVYPADQYIFLSPHRTKPTERHPERRQGNEKPIDRKTAYNYVNEISREIGIDFKIGCHTLRKTFGYHFYKKTGKIGLLTIWFNHSSEQVTKRYIGIDLDEMAGYAKNFEI
jgi:integrase